MMWTRCANLLCRKPLKSVEGWTGDRYCRGCLTEMMECCS